MNALASQCAVVAALVQPAVPFRPGGPGHAEASVYEWPQEEGRERRRRRAGKRRVDDDDDGDSHGRLDEAKSKGITARISALSC